MTDKKLAKKLAAEMQKKQMQRDFVTREEALDKETARKLKDKWFGILLDSKLPEMKENLRNVLDYMEKLVEVEVFRKKLFEEERVELANQLTFQAQSHSRALDHLYDLYLQRIHDLHEIYKQQVDKKKAEAEEEFAKIIERGRKTEEDMKGILYQMELNEERKEDLMKCEMFLKTDDEKSKNAEKSENLRARLERLMEKRWYQISSILLDYEQSTEHRRNHYAQLKARDKHDSRIIHSQMKKTQKLYDQIQQLKQVLEHPDLTDKKLILISDYRQERSKFYNSFVYLKEVMAEEMKTDDAHLKDLTMQSKDTLDYLDHFLKKGERILTLFSLCFKLETEKEKIVPVGSTLYTNKIPDKLMNQLNIPQIQEVASASNDHHSTQTFMQEEFQQFWQKFGKVKLSILALNHCISGLKAENDMLKKMVTSYLGQMTKN